MEQREDVTARIKEQADIVQIIGENVDLKRSGARFLGLCPFHGEKTPSFSVHPGQQFFHCFGCGESGDVFSYVMKYQHVDFAGALQVLAGKYNIELPQKRQTREEEARTKKRKELFAVSEKASDFFHDALIRAKQGHAAKKYLQKRGVTSAIIEKFRIGYAPSAEDVGWNYLGSRFSVTEQSAAIEAGLLVKKEKGGTYDRFRDRIVFPIFNISGQVCGFGGRIVGEGQPKYLNSPESLIFNKSKLLLGLYQQKDPIRRQNRAVLVEGNFDLISLVANGCENVVAPLGTALTRDQLRLIKRFTEEVTLLFDGDDAGGKAAVRAVPLFLAEQIAGRVAILPDQHDPDTYIRDFGLQKLNALIEKAEELPEFLLNRLIGEYGLSLDGKRRIVAELGPLVAAAGSPLQRSVFISHFAGKLEMEAGLLEQHLQQPHDFKINEAVTPVESVRKKNREPRVEPLSMPQKQLVEYMILNPAKFKYLAENDVRAFLAGSIGEILFLELEKLLQKNSSAEPEELLTQLPEGVERGFVADLLLDSSKIVVSDTGEAGDEQLENLVNYLKQKQLKKNAETLLGKIQQAQQEGNQELLMRLMHEQVELNRELYKEELST